MLDKSRLNSTPLPWLATALSLAMAAGCSGNESTSNAAANGSTSEQMDMAPECSPGDAGCACYGNGTCNAELVCTDSVCTDPDCPVGSLTCACYGNDTCNDGLSCQDGACVDAVIDEPDLPAAELDMSPDMDTMCQPITDCPVDACGQLDDGCGGQLECEPCKCIDGAPTEPTCGHCGLGRSTCTADGAFECVLPELASFDGLSCSAIYYVDAGNIGGNESGTKSEPFTTLGAALQAIQRATSPHLVVLTKAPLESEPTITLLENVSIVGGFDERFVFDPEGTTLLKPAPTRIGTNDMTVIAAGLDQGFSLVGLHIVGHNSTDPSISTVTMLVDQNAAHIDLQRVRIIGGTPVRGADGQAGASFQVGNFGLDAVQFVSEGEQSEEGAQPPLGDPACPEALGGRGGRGGPRTQITGGGIGGAAHAGTLGGDGGLTNAPSPAERSGQPGEDGDRGEDGADGSNGFKNTGEVKLDGTTRLHFFFHAADGEDGEPGEHGHGGGGGGGGAGFVNAQGEQYPGGPGGSGGNGGCAGMGGGGGVGGGSSIALLVTESPNLRLNRCSIVGGLAGSGGTGAPGGVGADGGEGGKGTTLMRSATGTQRAHEHPGGSGGRGGRGGDGGHGRGGHGGHSFGALCLQPIEFDESTRFEASGIIARGGDGRNGAGAHDGVTIPQEGCE